MACSGADPVDWLAVIGVPWKGADWADSDQAHQHPRQALLHRHRSR